MERQLLFRIRRRALGTTSYATSSGGWTEYEDLAREFENESDLLLFFRLFPDSAMGDLSVEGRFPWLNTAKDCTNVRGTTKWVSLRDILKSETAPQ